MGFSRIITEDVFIVESQKKGWLLLLLGVVCVHHLLLVFFHQQTDTVGGASTDEAEGRWPLVPGQYPGQEPH